MGRDAGCAQVIQAAANNHHAIILTQKSNQKKIKTLLFREGKMFVRLSMRDGANLENLDENKNVPKTQFFFEAKGLPPNDVSEIFQAEPTRFQ